MKKIFYLFALFSFCGCASYWQRKSCEKINWFQMAQKTAMRGQRMEQNPIYKNCQKVEAEMNSGEINRGFKLGMENYCKAEGAFETGRKGQYFNYDFCETSLHPLIKKQHAKGMQIFCKPESAFIFASRGGIYENQCFDLDETAYLKHYKKGRRSYLKTQILKNENEIQMLDSEISRLRSALNQSYQELRQVQQSMKQYNESLQQQNSRPLGNASPDVYTSQDNNQIQLQLDRINSDIETTLRQIDSNLDQQKKLRNENIDWQAEIDRLIED
jgi:hypothetical protein